MKVYFTQYNEVINMTHKMIENLFFEQFKKLSKQAWIQHQKVLHLRFSRLKA